MAKVRFTKMHGIGNDYIYFNCFDEKVREAIESDDDFADTVKRISHRNFGVGGDGAILILPSEKADCKMRIFNSDGSEAEMCGNGIRCIGKYVYDYGLIKKKELTVETKAGIKILELLVGKGDKVESIKVDMGEPILKGKLIPVKIDKDKIIGEKIHIDGEEFKITCVSMGNPHCVIFVDMIMDEHILEAGSKIENNELFPARTNVEFVKVVSKDEVDMRVWERGAGETMACGTGASAVGVAAVLNGLTNRNVKVHLRGGDLDIEWNEKDNHVYMTGAAEVAFEGEVDI